MGLENHRPGKIQVKICGLTRAEDAQFAAAAGADLLGVVFAPSKRQVRMEQAREVFSNLPAAVRKVGVFVDPHLEELERAASEVGLDLIQLHGQESPEFCQKAARIRPVLKVFTEENGLWDPIPGSYQGLELAFLLVDSRSGPTRGGTGHRLSASALEQAQRFGIAPLGIAGGLNPQNVGALVEEIRPALVDVSSGVESAPGQKDPAMVEAFLDAVRSASTAP